MTYSSLNEYDFAVDPEKRLNKCIEYDGNLVPDSKEVQPQLLFRRYMMFSVML